MAGLPISGEIASYLYASGLTFLAILCMVGMSDGLLVTILTMVLGWFATFTTTFGTQVHTLPWFASLESSACWEPVKAFTHSCVFALVNGE